MKPKKNEIIFIEKSEKLSINEMDKLKGGEVCVCDQNPFKVCACDKSDFHIKDLCICDINTFL